MRVYVRARVCVPECDIIPGNISVIISVIISGMRPIYSSRSSCHDSEHMEIDSAFCNECTTTKISGSLNTDCRQCVCV